jgi:cytochrome c oxidase subunit II
MRVPPADSMQVNVMGQKWSWSFTYANGVNNDTLVVPVNTPVKLLMTSRDVLHSFFIPAFRTKADVIPNRYHSLWFQATRTGVFPVECTQYCGTNHSYMLTAVKVLEQEAFDTWLTAAGDPGKGKTPAEFGAVLYTKKGCNACHSVDGSKLVGPSGRASSARTSPSPTARPHRSRPSISASPSSSPTPRSWPGSSRSCPPTRAC